MITALFNEMRNFQFHKGAIETRRRQPIFHSHIHFQFHKGAIETTVPGGHGAATSTFNSIKVRLKPHRILRLRLAAHFQFHKGAIETKSFLIFSA